VIAPTAAETSSLKRIGQLMEAGQSARAQSLAAELVRASPALALAHYVHGAALAAIDQPTAAEAALREALRLDPALAAAAMRLGLMLVNSDRAAAARIVIAPFTEHPDADLNILTVEAMALKALRRPSEATAAYLRARDAGPSSPLAELNLAGQYGDQQQYAESEAASRRAFAKGHDAPETWLLYGRALRGLGRLDEASVAFGEAIRRRPTFADAHGDLAQLIWMRTEDLSASTETLDRAIAACPADPDLRLKKAVMLEYAGRPRAAYASLAAAPPEARAHPRVETAAANLAAAFHPAAAMDHARRALAAAPGEMHAVVALCQAQLAAGEAAAAAETALILRRRWPLSQHGIALQATAWRLLGIAAYRELYDYAGLVRGFQLETPRGWSSLAAYIDDLAAAIERTHRFRGQPIGQSIRLGTQGELSESDDAHPAIAAFFPTARKAVARYINELGPGADPLRSRVADDFTFNGAWSVRLRPNGSHADHIHPLGWISSACHLVTPPSISDGQAGWLSFGQPGIPTDPALPAEHFVKPEPGVLVLFPAYMWHGTVPFHGEGTRLTAAFDVAPLGGGE
jgi:tetratricopeptide (TPR) repeat protein